jgi:hypothetical protein
MFLFEKFSFAFWSETIPISSSQTLSHPKLMMKKANGTFLNSEKLNVYWIWFHLKKIFTQVNSSSFFFNFNDCKKIYDAFIFGIYSFETRNSNWFIQDIIINFNRRFDLKNTNLIISEFLINLMVWKVILKWIDLKIEFSLKTSGIWKSFKFLSKNLYFNKIFLLSFLKDLMICFIMNAFKYHRISLTCQNKFICSYLFGNN